MIAQFVGSTSGERMPLELDQSMGRATEISGLLGLREVACSHDANWETKKVIEDVQRGKLLQPSCIAARTHAHTRTRAWGVVG